MAEFADFRRVVGMEKGARAEKRFFTEELALCDRLDARLDFRGLRTNPGPDATAVLRTLKAEMEDWEESSCVMTAEDDGYCALTWFPRELHREVCELLVKNPSKEMVYNALRGFTCFPGHLDFIYEREDGVRFYHALPHGQTGDTRWAQVRESDVIGARSRSVLAEERALASTMARGTDSIWLDCDGRCGLLAECAKQHVEDALHNGCGIHRVGLVSQPTRRVEKGSTVHKDAAKVAKYVLGLGTMRGEDKERLHAEISCALDCQLPVLRAVQAERIRQSALDDGSWEIPRDVEDRREVIFSAELSRRVVFGPLSRCNFYAEWDDIPRPCIGENLASDKAYEAFLEIDPTNSLAVQGEIKNLMSWSASDPSSAEYEGHHIFQSLMQVYLPTGHANVEDAMLETVNSGVYGAALAASKYRTQWFRKGEILDPSECDAWFFMFLRCLYRACGAVTAIDWFNELNLRQALDSLGLLGPSLIGLERGSGFDWGPDSEREQLLHMRRVPQALWYEVSLGGE